MCYICEYVEDFSSEVEFVIISDKSCLKNRKS